MTEPINVEHSMHHPFKNWGAEGIASEPAYNSEGLVELLEFVSPFVYENINPSDGRVRNEKFIDFVARLGVSSFVLPLKFFMEASKQNNERYALMCSCMNRPSLLADVNLSSLRWQLSYCYYDRQFHNPFRVEVLWSQQYLPNLLRHLAEGSAYSKLDVEFGNLPLLEAQEKDCGMQDIYEGNPATLSYMSRDVGQFGSLPLYDNYGDESSPYDYDYVQ